MKDAEHYDKCRVFVSGLLVVCFNIMMLHVTIILLRSRAQLGSG